MRSAERTFMKACAAAACVAFTGCAAVGDLGETLGLSSPAPAGKAQPASAATAADASTAAKSATAAAGAKTEPPKADVRPVSPDTQRAFDLARQALAAGRTADAERGFVALTRSNPDLSGPYANLGLIHRSGGRTAEAKAALQKAVELSPDSAELHNQLGVTYRMAGDFTRAKASYERAIALDPAYAPAVLNLGILYDLYLWDGVRALELYDRYMQLTPGGDDQVRRWITDLRNRTARKDAPPRKEQG